MRWYWILCPQCKWKSEEPVDAVVTRRIMEEVTYCLECARQKRPPIKLEAREIITNLPKGRR